MRKELGNINRQINEKNTFVKVLAQKIASLTAEAKWIAKEKLKELALFLKWLRGHFICIEYTR